MKLLFVLYTNTSSGFELVVQNQRNPAGINTSTITHCWISACPPWLLVPRTLVHERETSKADRMILIRRRADTNQMHKLKFKFSGTKPYASVDSVNLGDSESSLRPTKPCNASRWSSTSSAFPWTGLLALTGVVALTGAAAATLMFSHGKSTESGAISPTVLVAIIAACSNALLRFALAETWTISWWRRSLQPGHISKLHDNWDFGDSIFSALFAGRSFNKIALAKLVASLAIVQGPILQRASHAVLQETKIDDASLNIPMKAGALSPNVLGWSASKKDPYSNLLSPKFVAACQKFSRRNPIQFERSACRGKFTASFLGPGLDYICTTTSEPFVHSFTGKKGDKTLFFETTMDNSWNPWNSTFRDDWTDKIHINSTFKNKAFSPDERGCTGNITITRCTLHDAVYTMPLSDTKPQ